MFKITEEQYENLINEINSYKVANKKLTES